MSFWTPSIVVATAAFACASIALGLWVALRPRMEQRPRSMLFACVAAAAPATISLVHMVYAAALTPHVACYNLRSTGPAFLWSFLVSPFLIVGSFWSVRPRTVSWTVDLARLALVAGAIGPSFWIMQCALAI